MVVVFAMVLAVMVSNAAVFSSCVKPSESLSPPLVLISPCEVNYTTTGMDFGDTGNQSTPSPLFTENRGLPAIFVGNHLFVSMHELHEQLRCVNESLLPSTLRGAKLTGAGLSGHFMHLLFGRHVLRVPLASLRRWLRGRETDLHVLELSTEVRQVSAMACCDGTMWCHHASRRLVAYAPEAANGTVTLQVSQDEGATYKEVRLNVPAGSEPKAFVQYPSEEYGALFFNSGNEGYVIRVPYECDGESTDCSGESKKLIDKSLASVVPGRDLVVQTVLVTSDAHLKVSNRADIKFESATTVDGGNANKLGDVSLSLPILGFAGDETRWIIVDGAGVAYLGSILQDIWEITVHKLQPSPALGKEASSSRGVAFRLVGRTVHEFSVSEGGAGLDVASRAVSLSPLLAAVDEKCQVYNLTVAPLSGDQPLVDKSGILRLRVELNAAAHLAASPLVLPSTHLLASELALLSQTALPDGSLTSVWMATVRSHPEAMRMPYRHRLRLAELRFSSSASQAECPAKHSPALPVLVGCNPWLKLRIRNKRVENRTCEHLQSHELNIPSSPERDALLAYQQKVRGELMVRHDLGEWRVQWDPSWGCPVMSSDKAEFKPVLVLDDGKTMKPLDHGTVMFDIHGIDDFDFSLTAADVGCRRTDDPESFSWRRSLQRLLDASNGSELINSFGVLDTSSYVSCNTTSPLQSAIRADGTLAALQPAQVKFELFGVRGKANSILWADSAEVHVFGFHVVEPLFTYCDLRLTVPVYYLHAADVSKDTRFLILLFGVVLGLLGVLAAHFSNETSFRLKEEKREHLEMLLKAAELFANGGQGTEKSGER